MFLGRYDCNLDDKGRLAIPAKLRSGGSAEGSNGEWVLAQGLDHCLFLYPIESWQSLAEQVQGLAANKSAARKFARTLFAGATEVSLDKQGRVVIPKHLRGWAALERESVVVGVGRRIEVWAKEKWDAYTAEDDYEEMAEKLADLEF